MAYFLVINFKFLLNCIAAPVGNPLLQSRPFNFGEAQQTTEADGSPDTITAYFDVLAFLRLVYFSRHCPGSVLSSLIDPVVAQVFDLDILFSKIIFFNDAACFIE